MIENVHSAEYVETAVSNVVENELIFTLPDLSLSFKSKLGGYISPLLLLVTDYLAIVAALLSSFYIRNIIVYYDVLSSFSDYNTHIYIIIPLIYIGLMLSQGLYKKRFPLWQKMEIIFKISVFATIITIVVMYFNHNASFIPRVFIGLSSIICFIYLLCSRYIVKYFLMVLGLWQKPVLLIGSGKNAELIAEAFEDDYYAGYKILGIVNDQETSDDGKYPYLGRIGAIEEIITASGIKDVIIALPEFDREQLIGLVYRLQPLVERISIVPDLYGLPLSNIDINSFYKQKTVLLSLHNNLLNYWNRLAKRMFDIIVGTIFLALLAPLMLVLIILIKIDSKGKAIFSHQRVGRNGKLFPCYKFRTMVANVAEVLEQHFQNNPAAREEWEREFKLKNDPRVTRVGNFLRKTSLDELPQLINIILGQMSLVGPRPIVTKEIEKYQDYINDYYMVRPGLTGLWQVSGRNNVSYDTRVQMDSWYVRNWSFWLDITLLLKTVKVVLDKTGAY